MNKATLALLAKKPCFRKSLLIAAFCISMVSSLQARAAWWWPFSEKNIQYQIEIKGIDTPMRNWFNQLKLTQADKNHLPKTGEEIDQVASALNDRMKKALESKGYYDAIIRQSVIRDGDNTPVLVYQITPGQVYVLQSMTIIWPDKPMRSLKDVMIRSAIGAAADAGKIQQDATELAKAIGKDACLLSLNVAPLLELRLKNHRADLIFRVIHGPRADFGQPVIKGNQDVSTRIILRSVAWKQGDCYDQAKIDSTRQALINNQLLSSVTLDAAKYPDTKGQVPVTITVAERVPRTVTAGVNYSTDQGFGVTTGWEHRNFLGGAEKFNTSLVLAEQEQSVNNTLRIPYFLRDDQTLSLLGSIKRENPDAYTSVSFDTGATIERKLSSKLNSGLGVAYKLTQTEDVLQGNSQYGLLSFPGFLEYNSRDNNLDPKKGLFGNLAVTPYTETFGDGGQFLKTQTTAQTYFTRNNLPYQPTLALRALAGSIIGADGANVPSDVRFYAGGGGSVRGFSYQSLSPRQNGEPIGGSSALTGTVETRFRFTPTIGAVLFTDAGNAYDTEFPGFNDKLYYGAGFGARYYSPIGPLRADIAFPLNGADIGETGFAIYVSLGQAF